MERTNKLNYTDGQATVLVLLRVVIGWHFLYEGFTKLVSPSWSSAGFLADSQGFMGDFFHSLAMNPSVVGVVDFLNIWGLIAIGLGLILGGFVRTASVAGIVLLALYYLSHPPLVGLRYAMPSEGSYLLVNKVMIEMFALAVIAYFPTGTIIGIDRLMQFLGKKPKTSLH